MALPRLPGLADACCSNCRFLQIARNNPHKTLQIPAERPSIPTRMSMPIEVAGLHVSYRNKKGQKVAAVRDLSFEVQEGEVA